MSFVGTAIRGIIDAVSDLFNAIISVFKPPKEEQPEVDAAQTVQRQLQTGQPRRVLFGRRILGGTGVYDNSRGYNSEIGDRITVYTAAPITAFHKLYLNGEPVTLSGDPTKGWVEVSSHFKGRPGADKKNWKGVRTRSHVGPPRAFFRLWTGENNSSLGSDLRNAYPDLFSSADRMEGCCVGWLCCVNTNDDIGGEKDPSDQQGKSFIPFRGFPKTQIEATGVAVCDPRNGGDYDDPSTWSKDPAVIANAGLVDGMFQHGIWGPNQERLIVGLGFAGALSDVKDMVQIKANADYCDEQGFTCHGVVTSGSSQDGQRIRDCFNGLLVEGLAKIQTIPEAQRPHYGTVDLSKYIRDVDTYRRGDPPNMGALISQYNEEGFSTEIKNTTRTTYVEPEENYSEKDLPALTKEDWIEKDGGVERRLETLLPFVVSAEQAAKIEKADLFTSRMTAKASLDNLPLLPYEDFLPGGTVTIINSNIPRMNGRTWSIESVREGAQGEISWELREYSAAAHDFNQTDIPAVQIYPLEPRQPDFPPTPVQDPATQLTSRLLRVANSFPDNDLVITAVDSGADVSISISAHSRLYHDDVISLAGGTVNGQPYDSAIFIYYDDETTEDSSPVYYAALEPSGAASSQRNPFRHYVGHIRTPAKGAVSNTGTAATAPTQTASEIIDSVNRNIGDINSLTVSSATIDGIARDARDKVIAAQQKIDDIEPVVQSQGASISALTTAQDGQAQLITSLRAEAERGDFSAAGANRVVNSSLRRDMGFEAAWNGNSGLPIHRTYNAPVFSGVQNTYQIGAAGTPAANTLFNTIMAAAEFAVPVKPGDRLYSSADMAYARAETVAAMVAFFDASGAFVTEMNTGSGGYDHTGAAGPLRGEPAYFTRVGGFVTVPANAVFARPLQRVYCNGSPDPITWVTNIFLAKVSETQIAPPEYSEGPTDPYADKTATSAEFLEEQKARIEGDAAITDVLTAQISRIGNNEAAIITAQTTRAADDAALSVRTDLLESAVNDPTTGLSSRIVTQEQATADLQANKAAATALSALEAKILTQRRPNMILNPNGELGLKVGMPYPGQLNGVGEHYNWGWWRHRDFAGQTVAGEISFSDFLNVYTHTDYTFSFKSFGGGFISGSIRATLAFFDANETYLSESPSVYIDNSSPVNTTRYVTAKSPPNAAYCRAAFVSTPIVGNPAFALWGVWELKVEEGTEPTPFSNDRAVTELNSNITNVAQAQVKDNEARAEEVKRLRAALYSRVNSVIPDPEFRDPEFWKFPPAGVSGFDTDTGWTARRAITISDGVFDFFSDFFPVEPGQTYRIKTRIWNNTGNFSGVFYPLIHVPWVAWYSLKHGASINPDIVDAANGIITSGDTGDLEWTYTNPAGIKDNANKQWQFRFKGNFTGGPVYMSVAIDLLTQYAEVRQTSSAVVKLENYAATRHTIEVDANGKVAGLSLYAENTGDIARSAIKLSADTLVLE